MIIDSTTAITELTQLLSEQKLSIFAGSGISVPAPSSLPNWDQLLIEFVDLAENLPIQEPSNKADLLEIVTDAKAKFSLEKADPIRIATVLKKKILECNLASEPLALTDYNTWVSKILSNNGFSTLTRNSYTYKQELEIMSSIHNRNECIIHVHGAATGTLSGLSIDELIFTKEDYNKMILKKYSGFSFALRMLFTRYSTLFIGYGASDPHLEEILEEVTDYFPIDADDIYPLPMSYLIVKEDKVDSILSRWKERVRTKIISIKDYSENNNILDALYKIRPRI